jgi:segregation and condensation protein B
MDRFQQIRLIEAIVFASTEPIVERVLVSRLPEGAHVGDLLEELRGMYENRGVNLIRIGNAVAFRTAPDLASLMKIEREVVRKLSRAAVETLSIIAYHQPITRAEIEEVRGVSLSKGTIDILLEAGWVKPKGRRRLPGRPVTWGTTEGFLDHFGLETLDALPGVDELKAAGLLDRRRGFGPLAEQLGIGEDGADRDDEDEDDEEEEIDITAIDAEFEDASEQESKEVSEDVQAN